MMDQKFTFSQKNVPFREPPRPGVIASAVVLGAVPAVPASAFEPPSQVETATEAVSQVAAYNDLLGFDLTEAMSGGMAKSGFGGGKAKAVVPPAAGAPTAC